MGLSLRLFSLPFFIHESDETRRRKERKKKEKKYAFHYRFLFTKVTKQEGAKKEKRKKKSMRDIIHSCRNYFSINAMFCFYKILT